MKEPHHRRVVGHSMIVVAASLAAIGLLQFAIGGNVLFGDDIQRAKTTEYQDCKEIDFVDDECRKFDNRLQIDLEKFAGFKGQLSEP